MVEDFEKQKEMNKQKKGKFEEEEKEEKVQKIDEENSHDNENKPNEENENYIYKKKIYEKNIAEIELIIQRRKLEKLIQTKQNLLNALVKVRRSKDNVLRTKFTW